MLTSGEFTGVLIVGIIAFFITVGHAIDSVRKVKLAKHGCKETKDGSVVKL